MDDGKTDRSPLLAPKILLKEDKKSSNLTLKVIDNSILKPL